jgi:3-carboxy-cis,cis-muconate cycloisomerase
VPSLVASFLSAMLQEHERGVGGWQAEWPIVAAVVQSTGVAIASMAEAAEGFTLNTQKMRLNIENTDGAIFAERAMMLLAANVGRDVAHSILNAAVKKSTEQGRRLSAVLAETPEATIHLAPSEIKQLETPEQYLGSAEAFRQALASEADREDDDKEQ